MSSLQLDGLTLEQYAGITQAVSEGLALDDVLAQERVSSDVWRSAELSFREALVDAPDLQLDLVHLRRRAEDCLARTISPLDDDPEAWMGLMSILALGDGAKGKIESLGLTMSDVARVGRSWRRKMEADPQLAEKLAELAPRARPPTSVRAAPLELRRFPWSPATPEGPVVELKPSAEQVSQDGTAPRGQATPQLASFQRLPPSLAAAPAISAPAAVGAVTEWLSPTVAPKPATPFSEVEPGAQGVPLSRYAEVVAALQEASADKSAVLRDRDLSDAQWAAVSQHYEQKFSRQARWSMEFGRLLAAAQKALRERREEAAKPLPRTTRVASQSEARATEALPIGPALPELTVDQYAWIVGAVRSAIGRDLPDVLARFRLTQDSYRALEARWRDRMGGDPALAEAFGQRLRAILSPTSAAPAVARTAFIREPSATPPDAKLPFTPGTFRPADSPNRAPEVTRDGFTELPRSSAGKSASLPFSKGAGRMPIERYAEVSMTLEREGDPTATFKRLGIDPAAFVSTVHAYSAIFADDPALEQEFKRLCERFRRGGR